jgi:hypothetical protein
LFPSLVASSYVDDLLNVHVLTCASVITSQLWRFLAPVITELFKHDDAKIKYGNRFIETELCMAFYQLCYMYSYWYIPDNGE